MRFTILRDKVIVLMKIKKRGTESGMINCFVILVGCAELEESSDIWREGKGAAVSVL